MSGAERGVRPPGRSRLWLRSLTSRIVAGVVALVVLLVFAVGSGTYYFLRSYLLDRLDQQVTESANENAGYIQRCFNESRLNGLQDVRCYAPQAVPEWIAVLTPTAQLKLQSQTYNVQPLTLSVAERQKLLRNPDDMITVRDGSTQLRVTARQTQSGLFTVVTGLSTQEVTTTLRRLVRLELFIGAAAVLIAFAATSWGVQRSLRNLYRVTRTAQDVAAELSPEGAGLDRRVPVVEEGTEVGQLAESMNTLLAAVETQFKARLESEHRLRQFLADASHELRTPLTSIRGYAELARMRRTAGGGAEDPSADNLDRIESEGTRMSRLVDDLLLLARGEADGDARLTEHEPVDLADIIDDAVSGSRAAYPQRRFDVDIGPLPAVPGNRDQLLRAVRNLVTNAAVHTAADRPILVRAVTDAGGAVVTVADGGPGLPADQAAHVFERFWRADKARTRARGGSGLGLSIVAAIVQAHGGSVRFDSSVEQGSTATMWLPALAE